MEAFFKFVLSGVSIFCMTVAVVLMFAYITLVFPDYPLESMTKEAHIQKEILGHIHFTLSISVLIGLSLILDRTKNKLFLS